MRKKGRKKERINQNENRPDAKRPKRSVCSKKKNLRKNIKGKNALKINCRTRSANAKSTIQN